MSPTFWGLLALYLALLLTVSPWLGRYIKYAMETGVAWGRPVEHGLYRLAGVRAEAQMNWKQYARAVVAFNALGLIVVYALQRLQGVLPLNPAQMSGVAPDSAFNTAISFVANTNWQGYAGEATMSYLTQMMALTVQNFLSAATGIAVLFALIRGFTRSGASSVGNFWTDMVRSTLYVLLPLSFLLALALVNQGVIQNFSPYLTAHFGEPQTIAMGPVASQEAIKLLGTNGGGFFNANSAHPFENPTALSNLLQMLAIFLIPAALCFTFGEMVGNRKQGVAILLAMTLVFVGFAAMTAHFELQPNRMLAHPDVTATPTLDAPGGNMEGKESRFGIAATALFATITTAASCGAVNGMHDSFNPMGGFGPLLLMQLGEVIFGGVGSGLYGMLGFAILAVFVAGLMIGRTPAFLGKKIEAFDMKMVAVVVLVTPVLVLLGTAAALMVDAGRAGILNPATHGFSEILYAVSSAANNNGSAFAGLSANTPFYNVLLGLAMWFGRFVPMLALLALAGSMARKQRMPATVGTLPTDGAIFVVLLIGTVMLVGALTYIPALALGPIAEHLQF